MMSEEHPMCTYCINCVCFRVLIEDVTKGGNGKKHNGVRFAFDQDDRTVASEDDQTVASEEEDPGGGNSTGYLCFLYHIQSLYIV